MKTFTIRETASKGIRLDYQGEGTSLLSIPIGQGLQETYSRYPSGTQLVLHYTDILGKEEGRVLAAEDNKQDRRALILVEVTPGIGGDVKLFANTSYEWEERGRVRKKSREFEEAVGVELVDYRAGSEGRDPQFLLKLLPGAAFKISRTGKLERDMCPGMAVLWSGKFNIESFQMEQIAQRQAGRRDEAALMRHWELNVFPRNY
jgi:hypothetical protein